MLTMTENAETLKNKIKDDLDILDMDWIEKDLSRVKKEEEVKRYRQSNK